MVSSKKKDLVEYNQTQPEQLKLFESEENYSNTIELYDSMPKYYFGGVSREKGKTVDSLPILNREFVHRNRNYKLSLSPAAVLDKKTGKTIYYYPSQREELLEDVIRKIATKPSRATLFDSEVGVKFTYYEVQMELKKIGHGYSIDQIKLGIEVLNKSVLETTSKEGNEISITSSLFSYVGKETKEMGGKERVVVIFNPLVTKSISQGTYRLINYEKLMSMKMPLARWFHKRMSHMFVQATLANPYTILLSTIIRDSGMKSYKTISERIRQVEKALDELKDNNVIAKWDVEKIKEKNKILDAKYFLYMSDKFVADAKKANSITNMRLEDSQQDSEDEVYNLEDLRSRLENSEYGLSKTVINNLIENINNRQAYDRVEKGFEAAIDYINKKIEKNQSFDNPAAAIVKAIKENWNPPKKQKESSSSSNVFLDKVSAKPYKIIGEGDEDKLKKIKDNESNKTWKAIKKELKKELKKEDWQTWFYNIGLYEISDDRVILVAENKFQRDWILREYIEGNSSSVKNIITKICPQVVKISVVCFD